MALERSLVEDGPERQSTGYLGMIIFLASWAMMFAGLFFAYAMVRTRATMWPPFGTEPLPIAMPGANTLLIMVSSVTLHRALISLRGGSLVAFRNFMLATIALGIAFTCLQVVVWEDLWQSGFTIRDSIYSSVFYTLTAFHFVHVIVGLGLLLWLVWPTLRHRAHAAAPRRVPVRTSSMFWHFVGVVWVVMYVSVYLL